MPASPLVVHNAPHHGSGTEPLQRPAPPETKVPPPPSREPSPSKDSTTTEASHTDDNTPEVLILSLCDGIGAVRQAAANVWTEKRLAFHAWEIDKPAQEVCRRNWPEAIHHGAIENTTDNDLPVAPQ